MNNTQAPIQANDSVLHKPTQEVWVVCGVHDGRLIACGYPFPTMAPVSECILLEKRTEPQTEEQKNALHLHGLDNYIEREPGGVEQ